MSLFLSVEFPADLHNLAFLAFYFYLEMLCVDLICWLPVFRNFLLAERIMRSANCSPVSYPMLPPTHQHHMWDAWDMAAEICLAQLPALVEDPNAEFQVLKSMLGKDANPELAFVVDIWSVGRTVIEVGSD